MQVLLTVDTELASARVDRTDAAVKDNLRTSIYGGTEARFGIPFQLETLNRHGLKAVFFVEALSADVVGHAALAEIVQLIRSAGQEVQLHIHTEWLRYYESRLRDSLGIAENHNNIGQFPYYEQLAILEHGLNNLRSAGIRNAVAFRAGNYGADNNTLAAAAALGLLYDTSYTINYADPRGPCRIAFDDELTDCREIRNLTEVPITYFHDGVFGPRHLQICAVSLAEMRNALGRARDARRKTAVIVSHSFELLNRARKRGHPLHVARFIGLCRFLAEHKDDMPSAWFSDLDRASLCATKTGSLRSSPFFTLHRMGMQLFGRVYG